MVFDAAFLQLLRVVDGGLVADIEHHCHAVRYSDMAEFPDEVGRVVGRVDLTHGFHGAEDAADGVRARRDALPFLQVLDVPFPARRQVLQLPAHAEPFVHVLDEELFDQPRDHAHVGGGVHEAVSRWSRELGRLKDKAVLGGLLVVFDHVFREGLWAAIVAWRAVGDVVLGELNVTGGRGNGVWIRAHIRLRRFCDTTVCRSRLFREPPSNLVHLFRCHLFPGPGNHVALVRVRSLRRQTSCDEAQENRRL
ncbi:hypothetical protein KC341_g62 [Hortaea werneckii]|nr:hypothetical protein KC341_g62 [Hortaea werneckii]